MYSLLPIFGLYSEAEEYDILPSYFCRVKKLQPYYGTPMFITVFILPIFGLYSEADEYDTLPFYICKVHFYIILPSMSRSLSCSFSTCLFPQ